MYELILFMPNTDQAHMSLAAINILLVLIWAMIVLVHI
jgi:hypothetical protein